MPSIPASDTPVLHVTEHDERGVRHRRVTAPPPGARDLHAGPAPARAPDDIVFGGDPPLEWFERPPEWLEPAEGVHVVTQGPEAGRAAGYIRLHGTCFTDGSGSCLMPPEVPMSGFHRGRADVVGEDGDLTQIAVGSIFLVGGHTGSPQGSRVARGEVPAPSAGRAIELVDDPGLQRLVGVIVADDVGDLFLGSVTDTCTLSDARMVNRSDTSGEWWPLFNPDGEHTGWDLVGVALVTQGAFRKEIPERFRMIAAACGVTFDDVDIDGTGGECGGGCGRCACEPAAGETFTDTDPEDGDIIDTPAREVETPVFGAPTDDMFADLASRVAALEMIPDRLKALEERAEGNTADIIRLRAEMLDEAALTADDRLDDLEETSAEVERLLAELIAETEAAAARVGAFGQPTGDGESAEEPESTPAG